MSTMYATESFAVGVDGSTVWIEAGTGYPTDDPVVKAQPDMFTAQKPEPETDEQPKRRGRRG